ncbi:unnamed protein product [Symbiodinium natans]|uniref:Uncharacterized protein n=1 Tax=Symbiodinium natans TaxID=878477 RepID=A0A812NA40_9DINO|nr:unnamed protein product [Symbiodinium natans]
MDSLDSLDLQLDYEEACNEATVVDLLAELRASTLEVQQLSLRLKACRGTKAPFALPALPPAEEPRARDLRQLFEWLAETVDLSSPEILDVGFEVPIGGRTVHLHRVVQWQLTAPSGLKLTAPIQHQDALGQLLAAARATGKVDSGALLHFWGAWDLIAGELTTAAHPNPEPSVLLAHRASTEGILVASWPTREALQAAVYAAPVYAAPVVYAPAPQPGERVEVEYEGQRYVGILYGVDHGMATVRCDADPPGVMTVAPLSHVRRLSELAQEENVTMLPAPDRDREVVLPKMHRRTKSSAL